MFNHIIFFKGVVYKVNFVFYNYLEWVFDGMLLDETCAWIWKDFVAMVLTQLLNKYFAASWVHAH
jgi:hypothetical protein